LQVGLTYEPAGPRYRGTISMQPVNVRWGGRAPLTAGLQTALTIEKDRINVGFAHVTSGGASVDLSGYFGNWNAPHVAFRYQGLAPASELARWLEVKGIGRGTVQVEGSGAWSADGKYSATGDIRVRDVNWAQRSWQVKGLRASASATIDPRETILSSVQF